jgi:hypothetical protein
MTRWKGRGAPAGVGRMLMTWWEGRGAPAGVGGVGGGRAGGVRVGARIPTAAAAAAAAAAVAMIQMEAAAALRAGGKGGRVTDGGVRCVGVGVLDS